MIIVWASWIQRLYNNANWFSSKLFLSPSGSFVGKFYLFFFQLSQPSMKSVLTSFSNFSPFFINSMFSSVEARQQLLWLNENICIDNKPVCWPLFLFNHFYVYHWLIYWMSSEIFVPMTVSFKKWGYMYKPLLYAAIIHNPFKNSQDNLGLCCLFVCVK